MSIDGYWVLTTDSELASVSTAQNSSDILFETEPPNLFRNSLVDVSLAAQVLAGLSKDESASDSRIRAVHIMRKRAQERLQQGQGVSPIDEKFLVRRKLVIRSELLKHVG